MKFIPFTSLFHHVALDIGASRTRIWHVRDGLVVDEPTVIAVDERTQKVVAVGSDAVAMEGRVGGSIMLYHPISGGVIEDMDVLQAFLRILLKKVLKQTYIFRPVMLVSVPSTAQAVDVEALSDLLYSLGAREVVTVSAPLAAAIGADIPIVDASGTLIVQIGAGLLEVAVISFGGVVVSKSSKNAAALLDQSIQRTISQEYGVPMSLQTAKEIKEAIGSVDGKKDDFILHGRQDIVIAAEVVSKAMVPQLLEWVELLSDVLKELPPELAGDVIDKGMILSGGGANLHGLDRFLTKQVGLAAVVVEEPEMSVSKGLQTVAKNISVFKQHFQ